MDYPNNNLSIRKTQHPTKRSRFVQTLIMKQLKIYILLIGISASLSGLAQQNEVDEPAKGFKKENIYLGTGLNLGFGNHSFTVGLNPEIGYSFNKWLDAGIAFNVNYFSQNAYDFGGTTQFRNFNYGGGPYLRLWPVNFLFVQAQPEYNWSNSTRKDVTTNQSSTFKDNVGSLLLGVGYGTRMIGSSYSYFTLMIDVLQNRNSPYRDLYTNDPLPVLRAGFGFYLKPRRR